MKGVYLGACRAYHSTRDLDYNDIVPGYHINLVCDMLKVDLSNYDFVLASPPCNYYSRANYRRDTSDYALKTKHLLVCCLVMCVCYEKPFIIENVRNWSLFEKCGIIDFCNKNGVLIYEYGRHTYFTNVFLNLTGLPQIYDNIQNISNCKKHYREGGLNVYNVFEYFMDVISID